MSFLKKLIRFGFCRCFNLFNITMTLPRRLLFLFLSGRVTKIGNATFYQPALRRGQGTIAFGHSVKIGVSQSPYFYSTYAYIEARGKNAKIEIKDNVWCNNNFVAIADQTTITISEGCLIGVNVEILDSNFHDLRPTHRHQASDPNPMPVFIGKNVFLGNNVKILKGVSIGDNTVIGNASVVTKSIPENVIAAGNPCKVIRPL